MNGFLWLGVASTAVLLASIVLDGALDFLDSIDLGPAWLSLPVLAAFAGAFGFVAGGAVGTLGGPLAIVLGGAAGMVLAAATVRFSAVMANQPTDRTEAQADLLGALGRVVEAPAPGRYGAVLIVRPTGPVRVSAQATVAIPAGTEVVVVDVSSSTLVTVEPFDPLN